MLSTMPSTAAVSSSINSTSFNPTIVTNIPRLLPTSNLVEHSAQSSSVVGVPFPTSTNPLIDNHTTIPTTTSTITTSENTPTNSTITVSQHPSSMHVPNNNVNNNNNSTTNIHQPHHQYSNMDNVSSALPPKMQQKKRHNTTASTTSYSSSSSNENNTTTLEIESGEVMSGVPIPIRQYQPTPPPAMMTQPTQQASQYYNGQQTYETQMQPNQHLMIMMDHENDSKGDTKKRKRRNQAKSACEQCRRAHTACTDQKPCLRCAKLGLQCVEAPKKKQKPTKMTVNTNGTSNSNEYSSPPSSSHNSPHIPSNGFSTDLSSLASKIQNIPNMTVEQQQEEQSKRVNRKSHTNSSSSSDSGYSSATISPTQAPSYTPQIVNAQPNQPSFIINRLTPLSISQFQTYIKEGNAEKIQQICETSYQLITMTVDEIRTMYPLMIPSGQEQLNYNANRNGFLLAYLYGKFNVMNTMREILWKQYRAEYFAFLFKLISLDDDKALIRMYLQGIQCDLNTIENEKSIGLLSFCACCGRIEIFKLLCEEFQCSLFQVRNEKYLPIHFACSYSNVEIAEYILQKYPNQLDIQVNNNSSPLLVSAAYGSLKSIKFLIDRGANVNLSDIDGLFAIHYAVKYNHLSVVQYLAQHNADLSVKNNSGQTIFDFATDSDKKFMLELIVQNKNLNDRILLQEDLIKSMRQTSCK